MSELRDYQKKMLESKSKVVFCNWDRGEGKTRGICEKIIRSEGKCLCISDSNNYNRVIKEILEEKTDIKIVKSSYQEVGLWFRGKSIYITFAKLKDLGNCIGARFDNVFFDDVIPNKDVLDNIIMPMVSNQVYIMKTIIEGYDFEYIDSGKNTEPLTYIQWLSNEINKLQVEFSILPRKNDTTMTREKILAMIDRLWDMEKKYYDVEFGK